MTTATTQTTGPRKPFRMAVPLIIFLVLWAGWSVAWFALRDAASAEVDKWFAREAAMGRTHDCPQRSIAGYPFRIDVSCDKPVFRTNTPGGNAELRLGGLTVTALVYNPRHVIAELRAPITLLENGTAHGTLGFASGQASLRLGGEGLDLTKIHEIQRASVVFTNSGFSLTEGGRIEASSDLFELHLRPASALAGGKQDIDIALFTRGYKLAAGRPDLTATISLGVQLKAWPVFGGSLALWQWAQADGTATITALRMERGTGLMNATGNARIAPHGQWQGTYEAIIADGQVLFAGLGLPGLPDIGPVMTALPFISRPAEMEGRTGSKVRLDVNNGLITLGRFQLVQLPPAF